ncbi:MAG: hypothetical protein MZV63_22710 [Marinilabiliales bacterium]|nr:hypothetical protein [Marinilabiliales bacterium]
MPTLATPVDIEQKISGTITMFSALQENLTHPVGVLGEVWEEITEETTQQKHYQNLPVQSKREFSFYHMTKFSLRRRPDMLPGSLTG